MLVVIKDRDEDIEMREHVLQRGTPMRAVSCNGVVTSSSRSLQRPDNAVPKTSAIATLRNEFALYGRSFTYC